MNSLSRMMRCGLVLLLFSLAGCAASSQSVSDPPSPVPNSLSGPPSSQSVSSLSSSQSDLDKLGDLWRARSQDKKSSDYPVGVGDVVQISVPAIEELRDRTVRISGDGTFSLPFIGKITAVGLTEEELKQKLIEQLKQVMYSPRVIVFVKEYRSRQVAVLGSVMRPGMYSVTSGADTLLDLLSQAGGIAPTADPKIYLIPAEPVEKSQGTQIASVLPQNILQQDPAPLILKRTEPILIDMKELSFGGNQQYLSLQVRPGDVIMVPGGGQVLVEGWVEKPGAYPVTPGLTAAGVVIAAGGKLYPADLNNVKVIRPDRSGNKNVLFVDLEKIKRGDSADVTLQSGDIVEVSAEKSKLIGYGLYRVFSTMVNIGVGGSIPIIKR
jgi:protein involved in polysaccharide export with SLBB domain